jgi:hypothetical protein
MPIILEGNWTVQTYLEVFSDGCPEEYRPCKCILCGVERRLHRHDHYTRTVYTATESHPITIYRFLCPICSKAHSLLPPFIGSHEQATWDVQEQAIRQHSLGKPLVEIAESLPAAGGPYSEKTIWRWLGRCNEHLDVLGSLAWQQALQIFPHLDLPVGAARPRSEWGWLLDAWEQVNNAHPIENLLSWLYRRHFSLSAAPG